MSSKIFLGALPPDSLLLALSVNTHCLCQSMNSQNVQSVQKILVGQTHADTPQKKFVCAPLKLLSLTTQSFLRAVSYRTFFTEQNNSIFSLLLLLQVSCVIPILEIPHKYQWKFEGPPINGNLEELTRNPYETLSTQL